MFYLNQINYLPVLVAAAVSFLIGGLWYSKLLFAKPWMNEMKLTEEQIKQGGNLIHYLLAFILAFITALALVLVIDIMGIVALKGAVKLGLLVGVGFISTALLLNYIFEKKSMTLFLINAGNHVASTIVMSVILTLWH